MGNMGGTSAMGAGDPARYPRWPVQTVLSRDHHQALELFQGAGFETAFIAHPAQRVAPEVCVL